MKILRTVMAMIALMLSTSALAQADRGLYRCVDCPNQSIPGDQMDGTTTSFLFSSVNPYLNYSIYRPNDTVTICNGKNCMTFIFIGASGWKVRGSVPDTGQETHPDKATRRPDRGSEDIQYPADVCAPNYAISAHWEWIDYYSNGTFIGSDDYKYVVDLRQIGTKHYCV